jgi:hypothetical protein
MRAYDLDECIDDSGQFSPEVAEILAFNETYTEVSISGRGIRIWGAPVGDDLDCHGEQQNLLGVWRCDPVTLARPRIEIARLPPFNAHPNQISQVLTNNSIIPSLQQ